ncbi:hypothetical protein [Commensalibacter sp. W8163]|uniref:hypothetical protein n=1 Tax=Commensalibacter sp. W8163 TaxID=2751023 RepID=UPI0018DE430B|nr:hypothetical protein [Commensalibacter sp. W8163]MBI0180267.1 hypothetical protein [Commensalibacter sp. W8163]
MPSFQHACMADWILCNPTALHSHTQENHVAGNGLFCNPCPRYHHPPHYGNHVHKGY